MGGVAGAGGLAQGVGHPAGVVRHEAQQEDQEEDEDAAAGAPARAPAPPALTAGRAVDAAGDGGVAEAEEEQHGPEQRHAAQGGDAVPLQAQGGLQRHAGDGGVGMGGVAGQQGVGQHAEEQQTPGDQRQDSGHAHAVQERGGGGGVADDGDVAVQADEAHEHDAHVHGGVEEDGAVATHGHMQAPPPQLQLRPHLEGEGGKQEEVGPHHVLQVHYQGPLAGHVEKEPGGRPVEDHAHHAHQQVEGWEQLLREGAAQL